MAKRDPLRDSPVTIGATCLMNHGINLYCLDCHHRAAWTPVQLASIARPSQLVWHFKRRRRCSKCGARGSTERIYVTVSVQGVGSADRSPRPTAPQLWPV